MNRAYFQCLPPPSAFSPWGLLSRQASSHGGRYSSIAACPCPCPCVVPPVQGFPRLGTRSLHTTGRRLFPDGARSAGGGSGSSRTHYDTLNVPHDASAADIKKSFYRLSKLHHPDHNPKDPHAPRRFMRISEAYSVLGHTEKRAVYDRDVMRHHPSRHPQQQHQHHRPNNASYHSTGPAGGRPASGLSRRRSTFRGPPPSFYRNTGGGEAGPSASASSSSSSSSSSSARTRPGFGSSTSSGAGPGNVNADDTGTRSQPDTPHFDWASNERTHRHINERISQRKAAAAHGAAYATESSMVLGFFVISAALVAGVLVPVMLFSSSLQNDRTTTKRPKKNEAAVAAAAPVATTDKSSHPGTVNESVT